jgi:hypothetical protein
MTKWVRELKFVQSTYHAGMFQFTYELDGKQSIVTLSHSVHSTLPEEAIKKIGFNLGMCYLIDLAEIVLPKKIWIYKSLPDIALNYWKVLLEEVVLEKLYANQLPSSMKYMEWGYGDDIGSLEIGSLPKDRNRAAICLTGGKESLAVLKTLADKKPVLLFFLNPEPNVHRQRTYNAVKDSFMTIRTISNREDIFSALERDYKGLQSGVDMAHLVFNTMLYADICEYVLIGNEYSSNFPNDIYEGNVVNHQYVKTIHFAENINRYVHEFITSDFSYHSPFFGMYELLIADLFFKNDDYLDVWTSCNQTTPEINFCSNCYKCAFTYLLARTKKSEDYLSKFFSKNMLNEVDLYKPMMDFTGVKPLDCVGDRTEVWVCLEILLQNGATGKAVDYYHEYIRPTISNEIADFKHQVNSIQRVPVAIPEGLRTIFTNALEKVAV